MAGLRPRGPVRFDRAYSVATTRQPKVVLSWNDSTDNVGVTGYHVFRNGVQIAAPGGTTYSQQPGAGTFTYQVRARDAAGNVSALSAGVTVITR